MVYDTPKYTIQDKKYIAIKMKYKKVKKGSIKFMAFQYVHILFWGRTFHESPSSL